MHVASTTTMQGRSPPSRSHYKALLHHKSVQGTRPGMLGAPTHADTLCNDPGSDHSSDSSEAILAVSLPGAGHDFDPQSEDRQLLPRRLTEQPGFGQAGGPSVPGQASPHRRAAALSSSSSASPRSIDSRQSAVTLVGVRQGFALRPPVNDCIRVEEHLRPGDAGHYRRYTTQCPLARTGHCSVSACGKRRNCGEAQTRELGPAAPEAFLMVWRNAASSFPTKAAHQRWSPTTAEVRRYMVEKGWLAGHS